MENRLIMIFGPTGVGKSQLAIELAHKFDGEVISMDSMQVYDELDILTNKVTPEEARDIPHHLMSLVSPNDQFTAFDFVRLAEEKLLEIRSRGKLPIICGGTCYYAFSLFLQLPDAQISSKNAKTIELERQFVDVCATIVDERQRAAKLGDILAELDPSAFGTISKNPKKYEGYLTSYFRHDAGLQERNKRIRVRHANALVFSITSDATVLNARIDKRAEQMVTRGLKDEIRQFMDKYGPGGFDRKQFAAIGLKQLHPMVAPNCTAEEESRCVASLKHVTKLYAKRQEKYIRSKFCAASRPPGLPPIRQLDATNIAQWNANVKSKAEQCTAAYLSNEALDVVPNVCEKCAHPTVASYFSDRMRNAKVVKCEDCNLTLPQEQFVIHSNSRRHQKRKSALIKKARNLRRKKEIETDLLEQKSDACV